MGLFPFLPSFYSCYDLSLTHSIFTIHDPMVIRLAGVRFGSGSGVLGLNLNLHPGVRFRQVVNTNLNLMFRFGMFGSGFEQCSLSKNFQFRPNLITRKASCMTATYSSIPKSGSISIHASFTASSRPSRYADLKCCSPPH